MTDLHEQIFSLVCGQNPDHVWRLGGELLPLCQRCTGLYAGAAVGVLLGILCRPRVSARFLWVHGLFLLQMVPLGFQLVPQGPVVRTLSGYLFALGVVACLRPRSGSRSHNPWGFRLYSLGCAAALVIVPAVALWGGPFAHGVLTWASTVGMASLLFLALENLTRAMSWLRGSAVRLAQ